MSISVRCEVPEYTDVMKSEKVIVESVWSESSMVSISFGGKTIKVSGNDMREAILKCMHNEIISF